MNKICTDCASRIKTKEPDAGATWHASRCSYCNQKSYVTEPRDFGIQTEELDPEVEQLMNLFNMK